MQLRRLSASLLAFALWVGLGMSYAMAPFGSTLGIDRSQQSLGTRVQQALAAGDITPSEAQALLQRDHEVAIRESRFKADGAASKQERQRLRQDIEVLRTDVDRLLAQRSAARTQPGAFSATDPPAYLISEYIDEGVRSGRLTQRQARRLQGREREIQRHEALFKSDGWFTVQEKKQLTRELVALRDEVQRLLHDDRRSD